MVQDFVLSQFVQNFTHWRLVHQQNVILGQSLAMFTLHGHGLCINLFLLFFFLFFSFFFLQLHVYTTRITAGIPLTSNLQWYRRDPICQDFPFWVEIGEPKLFPVGTCRLDYQWNGNLCWYRIQIVWLAEHPCTSPLSRCWFSC